MAVGCDGSLERIFSETAKRMDKQRWMTPLQAMEQALADEKTCFLSPVLRDLARQLGKYDLEAQISAVDGTKARAETMLQQMEQEQSRKSGTYETLGICAGIAVAILLI